MVYLLFFCHSRQDTAGPREVRSAIGQPPNPLHRLILLFALIIMIASGAVRGFPAMVQGSLAQAAPYVDIFRLLILLFLLAWIIQLLGFGLFTRLLVRAGGEQLGILTFTLILAATILVIVYLTFRMNVELWAEGEAARTGSLPAVYLPLRAWTSNLLDWPSAPISWP